MKHSTKTNLSAMNSKAPGICRLLLLGTVLLGLVPAVQATEWGFTLIGKPSAEKTEEETEEQHLPEVIQMTGAGAFNLEAETASGRGSFAVFNGYDDVDASLGGPTFRGTWRVTDFVGWTPNGELQVLVTLSFRVGMNAEFKGFEFEDVLVTISEEGINVDFGFELFAANTTGSAGFHIKKP